MNDIDSCDEYEKIVQKQKKNISKSRGKAETKLNINKSKIFINCKNKIETDRNSTQLKPIAKNLGKKLIHFNDIMDISFSEEHEKKEKQTIKMPTIFVEDKPIFRQKLLNCNSKEKMLYTSYNIFNRYYDLYHDGNQKVLLNSQESLLNNMNTLNESPRFAPSSNKIKERNKSHNLRKIKSDFGQVSNSREKENKGSKKISKIKNQKRQSLFNTDRPNYSKLTSSKLSNFANTEVIENNNDLKQSKNKEFIINDEFDPKIILKKDNKKTLIQSDSYLNYNDCENAREFLDYFESNNNYIISSASTITGEKSQNEDSYLIKENIFGNKFNIYGVFDGHGKDSHLVSKKIAECIGSFFENKENYINFVNKMNLKSSKNSDNKDNTEDFKINLPVIKSFLCKGRFYFIKKSIKFCEKKLHEENINIKFSGSTCVLLFVINDKLICSNIGDSRCLLFKCSEDDKWSYINLSIDHKPTNEEEKTRIIANGGEIHPFIENGKYEDNIQRVWVKDKQYPGLAISRSIGDTVGKRIGIISEPTFVCKKLENRSKFIILGSDGFWDVMKPADIIHIVKPFLKTNDVNSASKVLAERAKKLWGRNKNEQRDDITVIVIFTKSDSHNKYMTNKNVRLYNGNIDL